MDFANSSILFIYALFSISITKGMAILSGKWFLLMEYTGQITALYLISGEITSKDTEPAACTINAFIGGSIFETSLMASSLTAKIIISTSVEKSWIFGLKEAWKDSANIFPFPSSLLHTSLISKPDFKKQFAK